MQLRPAFPADAVGGACFVTLSSTIPEGEQVIDLDRDLEALPAWGRLCLLPDAVRLMNALLGWDVDPDKQAKIKSLRAEVSTLTIERDMLRLAIADMMATAQALGIEPLAVAAEVGGG